MKYFGRKKNGMSGLRAPIVILILATTVMSVAIPAISSAQNDAQSAPQYGYPFSVLNTTLSEQGIANSYQLQIGMDDAGTVSLAQFNLNLPHSFYGSGNVSSEQLSKTNIQVGYFELSYPIYALNNAGKGHYNFSLRVQYWTSLPYSGTGAYSANQTFNLNITYLGTTSLKITSSAGTVIPGQTNYLKMSIYNQGTGNVSNLRISASTQSQLTLMKSLPTVNLLGSKDIYNFTAQVYAASTVSGAVSMNFTVTFDNPYGTQESTSNDTSFQVQPSLISINITSSTVLLNPGKTNNISFTFINNGNGNISNVQSSATSQSQLSFLKQFPLIASLGVGRSFIWVEPIYVSSSVSGAVTIDFTESFVTLSGVQSSEQVNIGFHTQQTSNSENVSLEVKFVSPYILLGINSTAVLDITNIGNSTVSSPLIEFSAPSGFTVTGNSTLYYPGVTLKSGDSLTVPVTLSSSPTSAQGSYAATVDIDYYNSTGSVATKTYSTGFLAIAPVSLIVQGFSENASGSTITVSGTLLDEGAGSAYYLTLEVTFAQQSLSTSGTTYLGEIDSNTPTPFSLTLNLPSGVSNGSALVSIMVGYQNYYGQTVNSTIASHTIAFQTPSSLVNHTTPTVRRYTPLGAIAVLITTLVIVILIIVGVAIVIRRRNRRKKGSRAMI
ncbi:MAG: hypothetical protein ACP5NO_03735 [Thermoplasmata archaeon]